jgi:dihydroorotase
MVSRRKFMSSAAAAAAAFGFEPRTFAAQPARFDILIKGGRVIDPSARLDAIRDVAITAGKITLVQPAIAGQATDVIDARGKLVVPGLIDIHTHGARSADGPPMMLEDGVTGWIDAGSQGADRIADPVAIAKASPQPGRVLINIGRAGILPDDVAAAKAAIAANRDLVVGVKARLSRDVAGANDIEVLRRSQEVASAFGLPVMIHMGQTMSPIPALFELLKRGDIV